jgi:hypothetical protein
MEKFEKVRDEVMISAAAAQRSHVVTTKVTTVEPVTTPSEEIRKKARRTPESEYAYWGES